MTDASDKPKFSDRDKAEIILKMTKEAQRIERRLGANACIVICLFEDEGNLRIQDSGRFPMPPDEFYNLMIQAHKGGQLGHNGPKRKILRPN